MPDTVLGARDTARNKTKSLFLWGSNSSAETDNKNNTKKCICYQMVITTARTGLGAGGGDG